MVSYKILQQTIMNKDFKYKKDVYYGTFIMIAFLLAGGAAGWWHFHRIPHGESVLTDFYQHQSEQY